MALGGGVYDIGAALRIQESAAEPVSAMLDRAVAQLSCARGLGSPTLAELADVEKKLQHVDAQGGAAHARGDALAGAGLARSLSEAVW